MGGSILAPDEVDEKFASSLAKFLTELAAKHEVAVIVGGGRPARRDIEKARARGASWAECDHIGILATRRNAKALIEKLGKNSNKNIPESIHDAAGVFGNKILVMGGTEPGHSTDAVAALLAEWVKADLFVNASNVDAVYDRNPREHKDAKPYKVIKISDLLQIVGAGSMEAGKYPLLDFTSARIIERSRIRTLILDGRDLKDMESAIAGRPFRGTTVVF